MWVEVALAGGADHGGEGFLGGGTASGPIAASALLDAEQRFRRVRGHADMHHLFSALDALAPTEVGAERVA